MRKTKVTAVPVDRLRINEGQLDWLPRNPRSWTQTDIDRMVRSMEEDPDFIEDRPVLAVPGPDETLVVFCHNLYTKGAQVSGRKSVACVTYFPESEEDRETIRRRALKDNGSFGSWDTEILANEWEFETWDLEAMGIPDWITGGAGKETGSGAGTSGAEGSAKEGENKDEDPEYNLKLQFPSIEQRKEWEEEAELQGVKICRGLNWGRGEESEHRCDLLPREKRYKLKGFYFTSCFHNTTTGERLSIIKQQPANIKIFADAAVEQIKKLNITGECTLVSAPARKHIENNFAENICEKIAQDLRLNYERGIIRILSKDRFRPVFSLKNPVKSECVILYDDILTTGKTIAEMKRLFDDKEVFVIIGIKNHHPIKS